ncbi:hypothetical protein GOBAR_DD28899 [Gossypium barbadense]|nr:hypothetical protein GOBAR_DD28899 [Gossypium barbadense]
MGRIFVVELDGRSYRCKFCRTHLALPDDLVSRLAFKGRLNRRTSQFRILGNWGKCEISVKEAAHEKSQKYKEGKFVLERLVRSFASDRGRIVDEIDFSSEVYIDTRPSMSDGEDA